MNVADIQESIDIQIIQINSILNIFIFQDKKYVLNIRVISGNSIAIKSIEYINIGMLIKVDNNEYIITCNIKGKYRYLALPHTNITISISLFKKKII